MIVGTECHSIALDSIKRHDNTIITKLLYFYIIFYLMLQINILASKLISGNVVTCTISNKILQTNSDAISDKLQMSYRAKMY